MRIGFWLTTPVRFDPREIEETPFGGAEISAIHLARKLAHTQEAVVVFGDCQETGSFVTDSGDNWNGVITFEPRDQLRFYHGLDTLICVRADQNLLNPRKNAQFFGSSKPTMILWTGDAYDQPNNEIFHDYHCLNELRTIVCKSEWQRKALIQHFPLLSTKDVCVLYNGVAAEWIPEPQTVTEPRFIYASTAYRGVHRFFEIWPMIKERIPDATLDCYCKTTLYLRDNPRERDFEELYQKLEEMDGVRVMDPLPQKDFLKVLSGYRMMLYPNSGFPESSCGVALQSMACGVPVITSAQAGLVELLGEYEFGDLCHKDPESAEYAEEFTRSVVYHHENQRPWGYNAPGIIKTEYSWKEVATRWEELLTRTLAQNSMRPAPQMEKTSLASV